MFIFINPFQRGDCLQTSASAVYECQILQSKDDSRTERIKIFISAVHRPLAWLFK